MHRLHGFLKYVDQVDKTWVCVKMEDNKQGKSAVQRLFKFDRYCHSNWLHADVFLAIW